MFAISFSPPKIRALIFLIVNFITGFFQQWLQLPF